MLSGTSSAASNYLRPMQTLTANSIPRTTEAQSDIQTGTKTTGLRIDVSQLKQLHAKPVSVADIPFLRDLLATNWLRAQSMKDMQSTVPDNAPQNIYAQVKVDGKVVATLYNGGSSMMTNAAAATVGNLQDPPGLLGPDLAQWRAEAYARLLGGTIEKASTAITQSQWTPRESTSTVYSREQLDAAFEAMMAESRRAGAQRLSPYPTSLAQAGASADVSA